jgi:hypothetical protein
MLVDYILSTQTTVTSVTWPPAEKIDGREVQSRAEIAGPQTGCKVGSAEAPYFEAGFVTGIASGPGDFCGVVSVVGACRAGGGMSGLIFRGMYLSILSIT